MYHPHQFDNQALRESEEEARLREEGVDDVESIGVDPLDERFGDIDVDINDIDERFGDIDVDIIDIDERFGDDHVDINDIDERFGDDQDGRDDIDGYNVQHPT